MTSKHIKECLRFEGLVDRHELTDEEIEFVAKHQESCVLGIHTMEAIERMHNLPVGMLREWNGRTPLVARPPIKEGKRIEADVRNPRIPDETQNSSDKVASARPNMFATTFRKMAAKIREPHTQIAAQKIEVLPRRSFIVGMTCGTLLTAVTKTQMEGPWLSAGVFSAYKQLLEHSRARGFHNRDRLEILCRLLKPQGEIAYSLPKSHPGVPTEQIAPEWRISGLPHNQAAIAAFRMLDPQIPVSKAIEGEDVAISLNQHMVISGSPVASTEARLYLPHRYVEDSSSISHTYRPERIPYHFVQERDESITVRSAMLHGQEKKTRSQGLELTSSGRIWKPRKYADNKGFLKTDFLLISRLPRTRAGGEVVLLCGAHGAGSGAFSLLFEEATFPMRQLLDLWKILEGNRYFQFVLECSVWHEPGVTTATKVSICADCPPEIIKNPEDLFLNDKTEGIKD